MFWDKDMTNLLFREKETVFTNLFHVKNTIITNQFWEKKILFSVLNAHREIEIWSFETKCNLMDIEYMYSAFGLDL